MLLIFFMTLSIRSNVFTSAVKSAEVRCAVSCSDTSSLNGNVSIKKFVKVKKDFHFFGFLSVQYLNYISVFQLIALN